MKGDSKRREKRGVALRTFWQKERKRKGVAPRKKNEKGGEGRVPCEEGKV